MENNLSRQAKRLLLSNILFRSANTVRRIFLSIYIFKYIGDLKMLAIFSILSLMFHYCGFFLSSFIVKRGYRNILSILSLCSLASIFIIFAFDVQLIQKYYIIFSIFIGLAMGAYWCVYNNNQFDVTVPKNRGNYEGWKKTLRTIDSLFTPTAIGFIITQNILGDGYAVAFGLGAILLLCSAFLSVFDETKIKNLNPHFQLKKLLQEVSHNKNIIYIVFIIGLTSFALSTNVIEIVTPLVFTDSGINELGIGAFISTISLLSIIASYLFGRYVEYKHYKLSYFIAGCLYLLLITLLLLLPSQLHFIVFITSLALLYIFIDIPISVFSSNYFHEVSDYKSLKSEYILLKEFFVVIGRMCMFIPMLFMVSFSLQDMYFILISMGICVLVSMILFSQLSPPKNYV